MLICWCLGCWTQWGHLCDDISKLMDWDNFIPTLTLDRQKQGVFMLQSDEKLEYCYEGILSGFPRAEASDGYAVYFCRAKCRDIRRSFAYISQGGTSRAIPFLLSFVNRLYHICCFFIGQNRYGTKSIFHSPKVWETIHSGCCSIESQLLPNKANYCVSAQTMLAPLISSNYSAC